MCVCVCVVSSVSVFICSFLCSVLCVCVCVFVSPGWFVCCFGGGFAFQRERKAWSVLGKDVGRFWQELREGKP